MTSRYPNAIDGYADIRIVRDGIEEVVARDHNDNRSAVIAIEQTLGLWPQGIYGTVVERLDEADAAFVRHYSGAAYRHVANHIDYPGSSPETFADGYALEAARLGSTINEIVAQLGGLTGDTKIGADTFDTPHRKFRFPAGDVSSQMEDAGSFLDEVGGVLENGLAGFVVWGMEVTRYEPNPGVFNMVRIAAGEVCIKGRMRPYAGGTLVHGGIGPRMICARVNTLTGEVQIKEAGTYDEFFGVNGYDATATLQTFTETGSAWTDNDDLRRFGMYVNNKPYITVGNEGHGADFTSLQSALKYVSCLQNTTDGINRPYKIVLVGDIVHVPISSAAILVPANTEIDGGGHTITWDIDFPLFWLTNSDYATLRNIRAVYAGAPGSTLAAFARIENSGAVTRGYRIEDCFQTGADVPYFLQFVDDGSGIRDIVVSGCSAAAQTSHVWSNSIVNPPILMRITGNRFYQTGAHVASAEPAIRVGSYSIIANNIIAGGYNRGIKAPDTQDVVISGNFINGGNGSAGAPGAAVMIVGIDINSNCFVTGNFIKGVTSAGIQCVGTNSYITRNFVDNSADSSPPPRMIGISENKSGSVPPASLADDNLIVGNYIVCPGTNGYGILAASSVIGNFVLGSNGISMAGGIRLRGYPNRVVANNFIKNVSGRGLNCGSSEYLQVVGNMFVNGVLDGYGTDDALAAIVDFGNYSSVIGNTIQAYGITTASRLVQSLAAQHDIMISNNAFMLCSGTPIDMQGSGRALITGNLMIGGAYPGSLILNYGNESVIANNLAYQFGSPPITPMMVADGATSGNGIIAGNMIIGCGGDTINGSGVGDHIIVGNTLIGAGTCARAIRNVGSRSVVANNFIRDYTYGGDGISVSGSNCSIIGNSIINQAGSAIRTDGYDGTLVSSNYISEPHGEPTSDGYGIAFYSAVGGQIVGNVISQSTDAYCGIYLSDSREVNVAANYIIGFYTGISVAYGVINHLCGNYVMQNPDTTGGYYGILVSAASAATSIVGNFVYGSLGIGISIDPAAPWCFVSANHVLWYGAMGINVYGTSGTCVVSNFAGLVADTAVDAIGINLTACDETLVVGNIAYGKGVGWGFAISAPLSGSELVMSGNLSKGGAAPSDGAAGTWSGGWAIDTGAGMATCIYIP